MREKKKIEDKEEAQKEVLKKKKMSPKIGEEGLVAKMTGIRMKVNHNSGVMKETKERMMIRGVQGDGEIVKNEKWINGDPQEIEMIEMEINVALEIVTQIVLGHRAAERKASGEEMIEMLVQEVTKTGKEIDVVIEEEDDLKIEIVMLREVHQGGVEEVEVKTAGEDPKGKKEDLLEVTVMGL